ncbi:hypothetical protein [Candidatus Thiosymbion oneisti]|uniref:hypothetical protein n=1 Tax=Candidatus Thiosymbion oneisti TaxID=589554 RepID=UPI000B7FEF20|nr:hypothetical protein [Candidatus Thiosymbion oneisti]
MNASDEAIWKKPAWITAIVGLISVFLTVPEIIGNYLAKQQDIEIAKENTRALKLKNTESKQDQEFEIVNNILARQGTERVFALRYLAATLDDPDAKAWATKEVERLDKLAGSQEELSKAKQELERKEKELQALISKGDADTQKLEAEVETLQASLDLKDTELAELRQKAGLGDQRTLVGSLGGLLAGLGDQRMPRDLFLVTITFDWSLDETKDIAGIRLRLRDESSLGYECRRGKKQCEQAWEGSVPDSIEIDYGAVFKSVRVVALHTGGIFVDNDVIPYSCAAEEKHMVCRRSYKEGA